MKKIGSITFISLMTLLIFTACSSDNGEDSGSYDPDDYQFSLMSTSGNDVDLFEDDEKALYLYFTGVE
ncbi:hypothetical protein ACM26V_11990 [Salipaludibacillus sp. HK11]|uniref:hypothetical protein n=1 Tax=Salipaludibacillus sp. HK11 TaxID=3394320 RepID=UPI0039FCA74C